jgi:hypothetical protein
MGVIKHHTMEIELHIFLNLALDEGELSAPRLSRFIRGGKEPAIPIGWEV